MALSKNVWNQVKNTTKDDLIKALTRDGFVWDGNKGAVRIYLKRDVEPPLRIEIHYHKGSETCGAGLLKDLFEDAGWSEADLKRLKLAK